MKVRITNPKDIYAGALFVAFGLAFALGSRSYSMGTLQHMGPAYFPFVLGILMATLGIFVGLRSVGIDNPGSVRVAVRPLLFMVAGAVLFAVMVEPLGLTAALAGLIFLSSLGGSEFRLREVLILWVALSLIAMGVFVYGLGLPFKVWPL